MHRKIPLVLTLVAWLFATGCHWDFVQVFVWAKMFSENARVLPLEAALERTFSPEGRCELCGAVSTAKQQDAGAEGATPGVKVDRKVLLVFQPVTAVIVEAPDFAPWASGDLAGLSAGRAAPPLPPPRV